MLGNKTDNAFRIRKWSVKLLFITREQRVAIRTFTNLVVAPNQAVGCSPT